MDQRVEKILKIMQENLHRDLSLSELAHSVNLSTWRVGHVFRLAIGMSPIQYLRLLRMERARNLLETSFLSVKEISYQVGLKDESHFVRDFKKAYGMGPTPYRTEFNSQQANESDDAGHSLNKANVPKALAAKHCVLLSLNVLNCVAQFFSA
jgi:transcriptional regulator GlxA family with amidase domain